VNHVVLLGDSIFDNGEYVPPGTSLVELLRAELGTKWKVTLLALDGNLTSDVHDQITRIPLDTTHIIVSCGGNDALMEIDIFNEPAISVREVMGRFSDIRENFRNNYKSILKELSRFKKKIAVCTVYESIPEMESEVLTGLALFNEVILKEAFYFRIPVIDLRLICHDSGHYSEVSPIEPSYFGGKAIVKVILNFLLAKNTKHKKIYI